MHILTDERCTAYHLTGHPERPERIWRTRAHLEAQRDLALTFRAPASAPLQAVLRVHPASYLQRLAEPRGFDHNCPWYPEIADTALLAAGAAIDAVQLARAGENAFSLMRPPGHHALPARPMGFCYLANAAIAAIAAREAGAQRVVVFDFDVHHGNGTEELLAEREGFTYVSVHRSPGFPHTGLSHRGTNCFNYPVPPMVPRETYRAALQRALGDVEAARPDLLVISTGFDAARSDPIGRELLEVDDFAWLGERIAAFNLPTASLLEGGYSDDLPELVAAYLRGLAQRPNTRSR